jgi:hypothetical protein
MTVNERLIEKYAVPNFTASAELKSFPGCATLIMRKMPMTK